MQFPVFLLRTRTGDKHERRRIESEIVDILKRDGRKCCGSMKSCPLLKSLLVRTASKTLYLFSSIPVEDASNGFRLFSRRLLDSVEIESNTGFTYSIELLVKCERLRWGIGEVPAQWEERTHGNSRFKVMHWAPNYIRWYFYGLSTSWLFKGPKTVKMKDQETDYLVEESS